MEYLLVVIGLLLWAGAFVYYYCAQKGLGRELDKLKATLSNIDNPLNRLDG